MTYCKVEFERSLDQVGIVGTAKRMWLKLFNRDPQKTAQSYFNKLERDYGGEGFWEFAKKKLLQKKPEIFKKESKAEPEPEPEPIVYDWDYFYKLNNYKWGDAHYDWDNYNLGIY